MGKISRLAVISIVCLFLATTFVSAGLLDYFTGRATEDTISDIPTITLCEVGSYRCEKSSTGAYTGWAQKCYDASKGWTNVQKCELGCDGLTGQCKTSVCTDSDGGKDYFVKGTAKESVSPLMDYTDICGPGSSSIPQGYELIEWSCVNGRVINEYYRCPNGCKEGACVKETTIMCTDSDGGKDYFVKGKMVSKTGTQYDVCYTGESLQSALYPADSCSGSSCWLYEKYCSEDKIDVQGEYYNCPNGCKDGACIKTACACTSEVVPVCGSDGKTYSNSCTAKCAGVAVAYQGECTTTETVKCIFNGATSPQKCYSGEFSCTGTDHLEGFLSCKVNVKGKKGDVLEWKSTCGGYAKSTMDGQSETIEFSCSTTPTQTEDCTTVPFQDRDGDGCHAGLDSDCGGVEGVDDASITCYDGIDNDCDGMVDAKDNDGSCKIITPVMKSFRYAKYQCYDGKTFSEGSSSSCKSSETWQSYAKQACEGHCYADRSKCGVNSFSVGTECTDDNTITPVSITETVKCVFSGATTLQKCYSEKFSCSGIESCKVSVSGTQGNKMEWKSSCNSDSRYTLLDGVSEEMTAFYCVPAVSICTDSDGGRNYDVRGTTYDAKVKGDAWEDFCYNYKTGISCEGGGDCVLVEHSCRDTYSGDDGYGYGYKEKYVCPNGCQEGACISSVKNDCTCTAQYEPVCGSDGKTYGNSCNAKCAGVEVTHDGKCTETALIKERVACVFNGAKTPQRCYSDNYGCSSTTERPRSCYANAEGKEGTRITWKSSCGGYAYTTFDSLENIQRAVFNCSVASATETTEETPTTEMPQYIEPTQQITVQDKEAGCVNSCPLNEKCYPFGYRSSGKFCSDSGEFVEQATGDADCNNDFECSSNFCVDGKCVSAGLFKRITDWFSRLFG